MAPATRNMNKRDLDAAETVEEYVLYEKENVDVAGF